LIGGRIVEHMNMAIRPATLLLRAAASVLIVATCSMGASAQTHGTTGAAPAAADGESAVPGYVIGADDVLSIVFWRDKDMSAEEVTVRPDGKVALPLLNDIQAAGLTPEQLRDEVVEAARRFVEDPNPTVMVKEINSRKVFITGQIEKPGPYPLKSTTTVLQLIATAGGLKEFVSGKNISVIRSEAGQPIVYRFNYQDVLNRENLAQNIELRPGDTVVVP
jgi:polysaccharide biosynthesis/export protein